jgi:hypothetical protein
LPEYNVSFLLRFFLWLDEFLVQLFVVHVTLRVLASALPFLLASFVDIQKQDNGLFAEIKSENPNYGVFLQK